MIVARQKSRLPGLALVLAVAIAVPAQVEAQQEGAEVDPDVAAESMEEDVDETGQPILRRRLVDATGQHEEWAPDVSASPEEEARELVRRGDQALAAGRPDDSGGGAIALYARALQLQPNNPAARGGIDRAVAVVVQRGETALDTGNLAEATRLAAIANRHRPQNPAVAALSRRVGGSREQAQQLERADQLAEQGQLVEPAGNNALEIYRRVLAGDRDHEQARAGLERIESALLQQALAAATEGDHAQAERLLGQATDVVPGSTRVQDVGSQLVGVRDRQGQQIADEISAAVDAGEFDRAEALLTRLDRVSLDGRDVERLRTRIDNARNYASFSPGDTLRDPIASGGEGPELVVVPLGTFLMGSPNNEPDRTAAEGPQIRVRLANGFAMARHPTTIGEFRRFVNATGFVTTAQQVRRATVYDESTGGLVERAGVNWQNDHLGGRASDDLPVIHVSWNDATAYADWLSRETGQRYRLPSEAEYEYALRAGGRTAYPWGDEQNPGRVVGNLTGDGDRSQTRRNWSNAFRDYEDGFWGPSPVRSFEPNAFGLYDMIGNVSEWVEDCWHDNYQRAPTDGSAWVNPGCARRVLRGASWASAPVQVRSAFRLSAPPLSTNPRLGFRVVREF